VCMTCMFCSACFPRTLHSLLFSHHITPPSHSSTNRSTALSQLANIFSNVEHQDAQGGVQSTATGVDPWNEPAITNDSDIIAWKAFSCHAALQEHLGPSKSLPVLSFAPKDAFTRPPKKSSLKFGNGNLAALEGQDQMDFQTFSSYLDVYKATYAKSAESRNKLQKRTAK